MSERITIKKGKTNMKFQLAKRIKRVQFGEGVLMPLFIENSEEVGVIIAKHKNKYSVGELIPAHKAKKDAERAKPLTYISFPNNEDGKKSLDNFRKWLDIVEKSFKECEAE